MKIRSATGQAKVLGTIICIGGSLVFTFWRGRYQFKGFVDGPLINIYSTKLGSVGELRHREENWLKGSCLILLSTIAWSGWLVLLVSKIDLWLQILQLNIQSLILFLIARLGKTSTYIITSKPFFLFDEILFLTGDNIQSLPSSIVTECFDLLHCIIAIFFACAVLC